MTKPKLFFYTCFGETLEFAEDLGWVDPDIDSDDEGYAPEELESEALDYIKEKGYLIADDWDDNPDPEVLKALENADSDTAKQVQDWYRAVGGPNTVAKVYLDAVRHKLEKKE